MDLVDIDKMLDDLESNEEEAAAAAEVVAVANIPPPTVATPTLPPLPKKFVGVSQVLSSLDDYCKDIESLEFGIKNIKEIPLESTLTTNLAQTNSSDGTSETKLQATSETVDDDNISSSSLFSTTASVSPTFSSEITPNNANSDYDTESSSSITYDDNIQEINAFAKAGKTSSMEVEKDSKESQESVKFTETENEEKLQESKQETEPAIVQFSSTMDDISDTELDSMFQEIDNEIQNNFLQDTTSESNQTENAIETEVVASVTSTLFVPTTTSTANAFEDIENMQNVEGDSFSQASTIEFAEMRLHTDFGANNVDKDKVEEKSTSSNSGTKVTSNDNEQHLQQRPNSLDLNSTSNQKLVCGLNAGQTPPAGENTNMENIDENQKLNTEVHSQWENNTSVSNNSIHDITSQLGKVRPFWIPDNEASCCMQCQQKFSLIKRRHHCRACGQVLCSLCCSQKARLEFSDDQDQRVCIQCHLTLLQREDNVNQQEMNTDDDVHSLAPPTQTPSQTATIIGRPPNPNNPMEYCSMIPPHQQVNQQNVQTPISVMVPVGVLKREGAPKSGRKDKNVIFSDGIRPGCDLTALDNNWDDVKPIKITASICEEGSSKSSTSDSIAIAGSSNSQSVKAHSNQVANINFNRKTYPRKDDNDSYIPSEVNELPPIYLATSKTDFDYKDVENGPQLITRLQTETLKFAVQRNFYVFVRIIKLKCCINKTVINFTTQGMHHVGQDEIVILLEVDNSGVIPKDIFIHLNEIYCDADKGHPISEMGFSMPSKSLNFLGTREHGGFLYIRSTFQCLQEIHLPESPFLIGILIHRWEVPWAKIFPLRLMLRLGAQYRYYPSPHVSIRGRDSVYAEIAQTIMNFLADFRNYSYTLATIKGMLIHMEDRRTSVLIPRNRYDQIFKALNNSSDHILALGGNFSKKTDGHLVCIQNMKSDCPDTYTYSTQAINIQGQPRKVTGASFIVLNGALKTTSGLSGKCSIVEDGLMVQILPAKMVEIRNSLKNMKDIEIVCGPIDTQTEIVSIMWTDNDVEFNIGVVSPIDGRKMDGIPSIRVHSGLNYSNPNHIIRWTEVFILQNDEETPAPHGKDPIDISKLSEQIARSTSVALVSFLDLLVAKGCTKLGLRATLHKDNVCYEAGSKTKLPPLYMKALDNELVPTLHKQATMLEINTPNPIILELIFHILDK